jgi:hypothetical protein
MKQTEGTNTGYVAQGNAVYSSTGHGTTLPMMYPTSGSTAAPFTTQSQSPLSPTYFSTGFTGSAAPYPTGFNQTVQQHAVSPGIMFGNPVGTGMPQVVYSSSPSYPASISSGSAVMFFQHEPDREEVRSEGGGDGKKKHVEKKERRKKKGREETQVDEAT